MSGPADKPQDFRQAAPYLTRRQVDILNLIKYGLTDAEIALKMGLKTISVSCRINRGIFPRLGAKNRAQAVYIGLKRGLIS